MLKYAPDIFQYVKNADQKLTLSSNPPLQPINLVLLGGAAIMIDNRDKRLHGLGAALEELYVVSDAIAFLHPEYMERVIPVSSFERINLFILSPIDIAISKMARDSMGTSIPTGSNNEKEFESLCMEAVDHWSGGRREEFLKNLEEARSRAIIREKHLQNDSGILDIINEKLNFICTLGDITGTVEPDAVKYLVCDIEEHNRIQVEPGVQYSAEYLLQYGGEALTDTRGEILMINLLKRHYERINPAPIQTRTTIETGVNPAKLFKLFKTLSQLVLSHLKQAELGQLEDHYRSPGP